MTTETTEEESVFIVRLLTGCAASGVLPEVVEVGDFGNGFAAALDLAFQHPEFARGCYERIRELNNTPNEVVDWQPLLDLLPLSSAS